MADSAVAITAGSGTSIDTRTEATNGNHRQVVVLGDPSTNAGVAPVDATAGLKVDLGADNDVTVTSGTITTVTTLTGTTTLTPGTGATNLGKAEDGAHTSGDVGVMALAVRNDDLTAFSGATQDYTPHSVDSLGRTLIVQAPTAAMVRGTASATDTTSTSVVAASGSASLKTYITSAQVANTGATTVLVSFQDGSGGTVLGRTVAPAGGGSNIVFETPLVTSANTALYFAAGGSTTTLYVSAQGYKAP